MNESQGFNQRGPVEPEVIIGSSEESFSFESITDWSLSLGWGLRLTSLLVAPGFLALTLLCLTLGALFKVLNILTCAWIPFFHRWSLRFFRFMRWSSVLGLSSFVTFFNPTLGLVIAVAYCYVRSFDFPHKWMQYFYNFNPKGSEFQN